MPIKGIQITAADVKGEAPCSGMVSSAWEHLCLLPAWLYQCSAISLGYLALLFLPHLIFHIVPVRSSLPTLPGGE